MKKILIIEDDQIISQQINNHLTSWGFNPVIIEDFYNVIEIFERIQPQLVLLDINLPFKNGFVICEEIRKISKAPIIFISSASENMNIVMAMNMGGDDFIIKPFDLEVLTAKITALIRRTYDFNESISELTLKDIVLNLETATLKYNNQEVILTKNEFLILKILMENYNKIISREELMQKLWNNESYVDDNTLTVNMTRLRKKISELGIRELIRTRKNLGYIIND